MINFLPLLLTLLLLTGSQSQAGAEDWRHTALPAQLKARAEATASDYHNEPLDRLDKRSEEALVDLRDKGIAADNFYARQDGLNAPYHRAFKSAPGQASLRQSVVLKLVQVNAALKPYGVELLVLDGYRPVALQKELWQYFIEQAKKIRPALSSAGQIKYASRYCSNPEHFNASDSRTWPTHATGAAVDVTLKKIGSDKELYMGSIFDDDSSVSHTTYYETQGNNASAREARKNRRLLYWAMQKQGFCNYPYEWWHFDYGNQLWLMQMRKQRQATPGLKAWYGLYQ